MFPKLNVFSQMQKAIKKLPNFMHFVIWQRNVVWTQLTQNKIKNIKETYVNHKKKYNKQSRS